MVRAASSSDDPRLTRFLDAIQAIETFEQNAPVTRWRYRGLHVWPIVKYALVKQLIRAMQSGYQPCTHLDIYPKVVQKKRRSKITEKAYWRRMKKRAYWQREELFFANPQNALPDFTREGGALILGSASGLQMQGGHWLSQHHHALRLALAEEGLPSMALYSGVRSADQVSGTELGPDAALDDFVKHIGHSAPIAEVTRSFFEKHWPAHGSVLATTGHAPASFFAFCDTVIARTYAALRHLAPVLRRYKPKAVFASNYANFYGWALAHLCRKHAIPFVDIQHGLQGRYNGAYHWSVTPWRDWSVLPSVQLSWTHSDAELFKGAHKRRKAAVIGPTWFQFERYLDGSSGADVSRLLDLKDPARPLVLFAAQTPEDILMADELRRAGLNILYRAHPTARSAGLKLVSTAQADALHCDLASDIPLPLLLKHVNGVITGYSATILEASLRGVPSLASGAYAQLLPEDYEAEIGGLMSLETSTTADARRTHILKWASDLAPREQIENPPVPSITAALKAVRIHR